MAAEREYTDNEVMCKRISHNPKKGLMRASALAVCMCANAAIVASPETKGECPTIAPGEPRCALERLWDRTVAGVGSWPGAAADAWRRNVSDLLEAPPKHGARIGLFVYSPGSGGPSTPAFRRDWMPLDVASDRMVLLLHGLDETGPIWDDLAPELVMAGIRVARLDYPNDQSLSASALVLRDALREMKCRGAKSVVLIGHSMGGLVARDALTRGVGTEAWPRVERLITVATPNAGSTYARFRVVLEVRERLGRFAQNDETDWRDLFRNTDGDGRAGRDLTSGSEYLRELNARPLPADVPVSVIAARIAEVGDTEGRCVAVRVVRRGMDSLTRMLGDGVVSLTSATLPGAEEFIVVRGDHRSLLRRSSLWSFFTHPLSEGAEERMIPAAIPVILDRLERGEAWTPTCSGVVSR